MSGSGKPYTQTHTHTHTHTTVRTTDLEFRRVLKLANEEISNKG